MWNYLTESIWEGIRLLAIGLIPGVLVVPLVQECSRSIRQWLISCLGRTGFIYLTMPGVVIHELSHLFFCLIFQHKIMKVNLFSPQEDGTLGMVQHSYDSRNIFHRIGNFFIGSAPVGRIAGDVSGIPAFAAGIAVFRRSGGSTCGLLFRLSLELLAKLVVALSNAGHRIAYSLERCRLPKRCRRNWISCSAASGLLHCTGVGWKLGGEVDRRNPFPAMEAFDIRSDSDCFCWNDRLLMQNTLSETMSLENFFQSCVTFFLFSVI